MKSKHFPVPAIHLFNGPFLVLVAGSISLNKGLRLLYFFKIYIYKLIYFWLHWVFVAACGLSLVAASWGCSSLRCAGFSLRRLLLLWSTGSRRAGFSSCGSWALERRLSTCGARAQLLRGMWDLPRPGLEPVSPALAGGFPTNASPGKPQIAVFLMFNNGKFPTPKK